MSSTVKIDPAHFVVRDKRRAQCLGYPEACADVTEKLIELSPTSFLEAYDFIVSHLKTTPALYRGDGFGELRTGPMITPLRPNYPADAAEVDAQHWPDANKSGTNPYDEKYFRPSAVILAHKPISHENLRHSVEFGRVGHGTTMPGPRIANPPVGDDCHDSEDEHRWSIIGSAYAKAMDKHADKNIREQAAKECFVTLGSDRPIRRGNATLSLIMLQYLAHKVGFEVPLAKEEVDMHVKSISRPIEQFCEEWKKGDYFDPKVTSEEVMQWHKSRAKDDAHIAFLRM